VHGPTQYTHNIRKIDNIEYEFDRDEPYEHRIEKVLDLLYRELQPNIRRIAKRAYLDCTTLSRRFRSVTTSRAEVNSEYRQCLTNT
jgi:uncharacterized protein YcbK (DUF882 family)